MVLQAFWAVLIWFPSAIWLIGLVRWRRDAKARRPSEAPDFTVLVAARDEQRHIGAMLSSVLGQCGIGEVPIVVADDHSRDRTREIVEALRSEHANLLLVGTETEADCPSPKKHALQQGLRHVQTRYVALTDADCRVQENWLSSLREEIDDCTGAVLGASFPPRGRSFAEFIYRAERLAANCVMASSCGWGRPSSACGHNLVYRMQALQDSSGFAHPEIPSGDDDLTVQAVASKGWKVKFAASPSSVVLDCGGTGRASRWQSASRHQSVLRYYPVRWRALFAWSVASHIAALAFVAALLLGVRSHGIAIGAALLFALDIMSGVLVARRVRLDISAFEIVSGAILLPLWSVWRAASALCGRRYAWRGRSFSASDAVSANV